MIAVLCPTLKRPKQLSRMMESVNRTADSKTTGIYVDEREMMPTVQKWNDLSGHAMSMDKKLFMLGSDDIIFDTPGWDKALIDHYNALENKIHVYAFQDSRDPDGTPHPIVTREYIEAMGYFVPPIFLHWFVDGWTVAIAKANNCFTHMRDFKLTHDKPSDRGEGDETHNRIRAWGWRERDAYVDKTCRHFLTDESFRLSRAMNAHTGSSK